MQIYFISIICICSEKSEKTEDIIKIQWNLLADIVDRLFFYIFSISAVSSLVAIMNIRT